MHSVRKDTLKIDDRLERCVYLSVLVLLASLTFSKAIMEISFVTALLPWLYLKSKKPSLPNINRTAFFFLVGFVLLSSISFFWSEYPKQSFRGILKVFKQFLIFWIVSDTLITKDRQNVCFRLLVFLFIFLGLDGMWQYVFGKDLLRQMPFEMASSGPRISASLNNYGLLAAFVISFLPLFWAALSKKKSFSFPTALGMTLGTLLLFWTRLRSAWIAFWFGLFFYVLFEKKRLTFLALLGLLTFAGMFLLPRAMMIHMDYFGKEQSLVERLDLWDRAFQVIGERPWTGTGINTYAVAHQKYDRRQSWRVKNYYAHNGYLQIAAETGLPSLFCFLAFWLLYFAKSFRCFTKLDGDEKRMLIGFLTGLLNFMVLGLLDTNFHNPQVIHGFWFLAGWGIAYQNTISATEGVSGRRD